VDSASCEICGASLVTARIISVEHAATTRVAGEAKPSARTPRPTPTPRTDATRPAAAPATPREPLPLRAAARHATRWTLRAGAIAFAGLLAGASLLTYRLAGADGGAVVQAALAAVWKPAVIAAAACWMALAIDRVATLRAATSPTDARAIGRLEASSCLAAAGLCIAGALHASRTSYVVPATWTLIAALVAGTAALTAVRGVALNGLLSSRTPELRRRAAVVSGAAIAIVALGAGWLVSSSLTVGSNAPSADDVSLLAQAAPLARCRAVDSAHGGPPLLRDAIRAEVVCTGSGGRRGRFVWLRSGALMDLYASARAARRGSYDAETCAAGAAYRGSWHKDARPSTSLGQLLCVRDGGGSHIEWADDRDDVYSVVTAPGSLHALRAWWTHHDVALFGLG
jgi:hypothetical protein